MATQLQPQAEKLGKPTLTERPGQTLHTVHTDIPDKHWTKANELSFLDSIGFSELAPRN